MPIKKAVGRRGQAAHDHSESAQGGEALEPDSLTVNDDGASRLDTSEGNGVFIPDDQRFYFGGGLDFSILHDSATGEMRVRDESAGSNLLRLHSGGPVEVQNANLRMNAGRAITLPNARIYENGQSDITIDTPNIDGTNSLNVWDAYNGQRLMSVNEGGPVEIPNGNVNMSDVSQFNAQLGGTSPKLQLVNNLNNNSGRIQRNDGYTHIFDEQNGLQVARFLDGGNVTLPNGDLNLNGGQLDVTATAPVVYHNVASGATGAARYVRRVQHAGTSKWEEVLNSDTNEALRIRDKNSNEVMRFVQGGDVEMRSGGLIVTNSTVRVEQSGYWKFTSNHPDGTATWAWRHLPGDEWSLFENDNNISAIEARTGGRVDIPNGELKLGDAAEYQPVSQPASPTSGWKIFTDSADGSLKAIDSAGNVTTLAT